jgi:hypothetical protein
VLDPIPAYSEQDLFETSPSLENPLPFGPKGRRRRLAPFDGLLAGIGVASIAVLVWFASDHARLRSAVTDVSETSDPALADWSPAHPDPEWRTDDPAELAAFRSEAASWSGDDPSTLPRALSIASRIDAMASPKLEAGTVAATGADLPTLRAELGRGAYLDCGRSTRLFLAYVRSLGMTARTVAIEFDDGLGGGGHSMAEVWLPETGKWALVDPQTSSWFTKGETPQSLFELRCDILRGAGGGIRLHWNPDNQPTTADELMSTLTEGVRHILYYRTNRVVRHGAGERLLPEFLRGRLGRIERPLRRLIDTLAGSADRRLHLVDEWAAPYHSRRAFLASRIALAALLLSAFGLVVRRRPFRTAAPSGARGVILHLPAFGARSTAPPRRH